MTMREIRIDPQRPDARQMRFDAAPVGKARRDARGFLVVPARPTRCGVFPYKRADGAVIYELRHPDDVFHPASLASLEGASVTHLHPTGFVSPENAGKVEIGVAGAGRKDGAFVAAELSVRRADAIAKVDRNELVECSCSYSLDIDPTPGVYEGQRYDQRQTNIRYNHVALGPKGWGRAGPDVRLMRHDSAFVVLDEQAFGAADDAPAELSDLDQELSDRFDAAVERLRTQGQPPANRADQESDDDDDGSAEEERDDDSELESRLDAALKRHRGAR